MARQVLQIPDVPATLLQAATAAATYVPLAGGSVLTGFLGPTTTNTRDLGTTALRWRKLWAMDGEFTNVPTVGGVALPTSAGVAALYLPLAGGSLNGPLVINVPLDIDALRLKAPRARAAVQADTGTAWARFGQEYAGSGTVLSDNLYTHASFTGTGWGRDDTARGGSALTLNQHALALLMAKPGANPIASWVNRWSIDAAGKWFIYGDSGALPGGGTQLQLQRGAAATDWQAFRFGGGVAYDAALFRRPNSDSVSLGFSNDGTTFSDIFQFQQAGNFYVGDQTGGGVTAQQRYIRLAWNASSGASGATCVIELATPNPGMVGIDLHIPNVAKYGMLYGNASSINLGYDIGWGKPATLYVNAQTTVFQVGTAGGAIYIHGGNSTNGRIATGIGNLELSGAAGYVHPSVDNFLNLGATNLRFTQVCAVAPAINTSHVSLKEHFSPLDPAACAEAVLGTDWMEFDYKPSVRGDLMDDETYARVVAESVDTRHQRGYVLGSDDYRVSDLFGLRDRKSASTHADLAVVACALQQALQRIAALEARPA